jgi:hypothetical protein
MVSLRTISVAFIAVFTLATSAEGQRGTRPFEDSWFWGLSGGGLLYSTSRVENATAPMVGAEWLITRTRSGLYVGYDHSFFETDASVENPLSVTGEQEVTLQNMRRLTFAAVAFPKKFGGLRPYVGGGFALHFLGDATPAQTFGSYTEQNLVEMFVEDRRSQAAPIILLGLQGDLGRLTLFAQGSATPIEGFFLNGGALYTAHAGLRLNVGSSIEQIR